MLLVCAGTAAAVLYTAPNYPLLLTGRVTYGLGIGFAMHAAPAYIAETAAASVRGLLIRCAESCKLFCMYAQASKHTVWVLEYTASCATVTCA